MYFYFIFLIIIILLGVCGYLSEKSSWNNGIVVDSLELLLETVIKNSSVFNVYNNNEFEGFKTEEVMEGVFIY